MLPEVRLGPGALEPPRRAGRDWALAALVATVTVAEVFLRDAMVWRPLALAVGMLLAATMLWRRAHPLAAVTIAFGTFMVLDVASIVTAGAPFSPYAGGFVLVLVYSLLRWASTAHATVGVGVALITWMVSVIADAAGTEAAVGGALVLLFAATLGVSMRYRAIILAQQFEHVRSRERESLARELHDTVAHHVSAIAIQAQAGRLLASSHDIDGAAETLRVIEHEASTTLKEMRSMVGALRRDGSIPDLFSSHGLADIDDMATTEDPSDGPVIEVERRGDLADLRSALQAALYRVAQESITNAQRHARRPTRIHVLVDGGRQDVRLAITDDGERISPSAVASGYGLVGMAERVALLGGSLHAGPLPEGGWRVEATIPRSGGPT